jgi:hypothetical protein
LSAETGKLEGVSESLLVRTCPVVKVKNCAELDVPTARFPKVSEVGEKSTVDTAALTVSVAALLVAVPAELLTTASNVDPLSEVTVAAVV